MTLLPPPDNNEREEIMDETSVTSCDGRIHNSLIIVVNQVIKFFKVIGWFSGNIVGSFLFGQNNILLVLQMVTNKLSQIMISQKNLRLLLLQLVMLDFIVFGGSMGVATSEQ